MTKRYFDDCLASASSLEAVQDRMTILMSLLNVPTEFYAEDIGLSGGTVQMLKGARLIKEVPGKTKEVFICVDEEKEMYKRITVKYWQLTLDHKTYREGLEEYIKEVADVFASALILTKACRF